MSRVSLPTHVRPVLYEICLQPDFNDQTFDGRVMISCDVEAPTDHIKLNCKFISIQEAVVEYGGVRTILGEDAVSYDELEETVLLNPGMQASPGETIKIDLSYTGRFADNLEGFYQAHYTSADDKEYHMAVTFMEPTYARQVFPCFDEPEHKAHFIISAVVDESFICRSNMPVERSYSLTDSKRFYLFEKSPPMSTYLVALIAGPLSEIKSQDSRVPLSILCPYGSEDETAYALDLAKMGLELFEEWFDCSYPLPKLDLVAVPDFCTGAMENWGLIIFRSRSLLVSQDEVDEEDTQLVTGMVLHEVSHMWFGNLVTMKYWDGLWLKEGFATLMSWMAKDVLKPYWDTWNDYVSDHLQSALELDSLKGSRPVERVVRNASEAKQIFDVISYKKGCSILYMLSKELGWDKFLAGVILYINRHQYKATESEEFWTALEDATGVPIKIKMETWTKNAGFPIINVTELLHEETGELIGIKLNQERFIGNVVDRVETSQQIYPLSIGIRSEEGVEMVEMREQELVVRLNGKSLVKVNADHDGFFRTLYSPAHLQKLIQVATEGHLTPRDTIGLACDARALVGAGYAQSSTLLDLSLGLKSLTHLYAWKTIYQSLQSIRSTYKFSDPMLKDALDRLTVSILGPKAQELGWLISQEDEGDAGLLKSLVFFGAGLAGDAKVIEAAKSMFAKRISGDENAIHALLRFEVFGIVAEHGGKKELEALLDIWINSASHAERYLALECLGRASNAELMRWVLSLAFTKAVKDQDIYLLIWDVGSSAHGASELWKWFKSNMDRIERAVPVTMQCLMLDLILGGLGTAEHIADVKSYFAERDTTNYKQVIDRHLDGMEIRRQWSERDEDNIRAWLTTHGFLGS